MSRLNPVRLRATLTSALFAIAAVLLGPSTCLAAGDAAAGQQVFTTRCGVCHATEPGVKVTVIVQLAPAFRLVPQVSVSAKLLLAAMLVMLSVVAPMLLRVKVCAGLVVLICWLAKLKLPVDRRTEVTGTTNETVTV